MATRAQIAPEEYLRMTFNDRPWPDLVDGELRERGMPTDLHGWLQLRMGNFLLNAGLFAASELHLNLGGGEYRVADLAAYERRPPLARPPTSPLITVEIVSPDDRHQDVITKCKEYVAFDVKYIWVIDPNVNLLHTYSQAGLANVEAFELPERNFRVTLADLLAGLDA